jgi:hypothetical protein
LSSENYVKIGWLVDEPEDFVLESANVDAEIAKIAGQAALTRRSAPRATMA